MTKVDKMVRRLLLAYPTLFSNRFEAFISMMTTSNCEWKDGELVFTSPIPKTTPQRMISFFEAKEAEQTAKLNDPKEPKCLKELFTVRVFAARREFMDACFIAENIDLFASTYLCCDYKDHLSFLYKVHRHGINPYCPINNRPEDIKPIWSKAIREWLGEMMATANNTFGYWAIKDGKGGFVACEGYETVFNWLRDTYKAYETPEDVAQMERMVEIAKEVAKEISET